MRLYLKTRSTNKAKSDIDLLCERAGFRNAGCTLGGDGKVTKFFEKLLSVAMLPFRIGAADVLLIQYPYKKYYAALCRIARWRGAKSVTLIHDLGAFRRKKLTPEKENSRLALTDAIISHNAAMTAVLRERGCKRPIVDLDIFDFLSDVDFGLTVSGCSTEGYTPPHHIHTENLRIAYAGALGLRKNRFLLSLPGAMPSSHVHIAGRGMDLSPIEGCANVTLHGLMPPDAFISQARSFADWGLVWDGDSLDECSGEWGEYLRINNPHKASFYLRAGLPVIVWRQSAMAPFVERMNVGIAVDSLHDLERELKSISPEAYAGLRANAEAMARSLTRGEWFSRAFAQAESSL